MASEATLERLFAEFDSPPEHIRSVVTLLEGGATPALLAHYLRWAIGNLAEERVQALADRLHALTELEQRKQAIRQQAEERGSWTPELAATVTASVDQDLVDDLYQSLRPRRRGLAMQMEEKGLMPLALAIQHRQLGDQTLQEVAAQYLAPEQGLATVENVLEGALLILSDRISHDAHTRARCRDELRRGVLRARAKSPDRGADARYQEFFDFAEPIQRIPAGRMLALRRAEREGILQLELTLPEDRHRLVLRELHAADLADDSPLLEFYQFVFDHAWKALQDFCGGDVRRRIKEKADREAVRTYSRNLRSQLMAPPLGSKKVLALRASGKGGWAVLLAEDGSVSQYKTLPMQTDEQQQGAIDWLAELLAAEQPAAIAVPHGRRQGATEKITAALRAKVGKLPMIVPIDEAASTIYASGNAGKKAMPGIEVGVRTTVSLGRRLQDPLLELVRMDVRALGLGHVDDVHQGMLQRELGNVASSCLAAIGIDLNTCDKDLLQQLPGLTPEQAQAILEHRRKVGGFKSRAELAEVPGLDATTARNIAGFLRVQGGSEPLDGLALHPDDYDITRAVAAKRGVEPVALLGTNLRDFPADELVTDEWPRPRVIAVLQQLHYGREELRGELVATDNEGVNTIADLAADRELRGRVTSMTEFGAFIDLGIGQDGLAHVSQIPGHRLRDPDQMLRVGEVVTVWVLHVDQEKRKISLSMLKPRHLQEGRLPTLGERMALQQGRRPRHGAPEGDGADRGAAAAHAGRPPRAGGPGERRPRQGRSAPRGPGERDNERSGSMFGFGGRDRDRPSRDRGPREQRVYTVEPAKEIAVTLSKKGELTSLSGLGALFGGSAKAKPAAEPKAPAEIESPTESPPPVPPSNSSESDS